MKTISAKSVSAISRDDLTGNQPGALSRFITDLSQSIGGLDPFSDEGRVAVRLQRAAQPRYRINDLGFRIENYPTAKRLGGTTYQYSRWAVIDPRDGELMLIETGDDRGRWIEAACRPWNGGDRL